MSIKSTEGKYGSVAVSIHWLTVLLVVTVFTTGAWLADYAGEELKIILLRIHAPVGITILLLTLFRLFWWLKADKKPLPVAGPKWQQTAATTVHWTFYVALVLLTTSGIGMMILSGAGEILVTGVGPLPNFFEFLPRGPHGIGAKVLLALIVLHVGAALHHQFIRKDGLVTRMWYGSPK